MSGHVGAHHEAGEAPSDQDSDEGVPELVDERDRDAQDAPQRVDDDRRRREEECGKAELKRPPGDGSKSVRTCVGVAGVCAGPGDTL